MKYTDKDLEVFCIRGWSFIGIKFQDKLYRVSHIFTSIEDTLNNLDKDMFLRIKPEIWNE